MEGFSRPRSNKSTASLPSPLPIDMQSHCSTPLALCPSGCAKSQPCAGSMPHWDTRLSGHAGPLLPTRSTTARIPALWVTGPSSPPHSNSSGIPAPCAPHPQALLGPSSAWNDQVMPCWDPHPLRPGTSSA
jgi:hypothetical protein